MPKGLGFAVARGAIDSINKLGKFLSVEKSHDSSKADVVVGLAFITLIVENGDAGIYRRNTGVLTGFMR